MHKMVLFSIAALASLAGAAIAQTPEPEPAWRKSALALVPTQRKLGAKADDGVRGWWRAAVLQPGDELQLRASTRSVRRLPLVVPAKARDPYAAAVVGHGRFVCHRL